MSSIYKKSFVFEANRFEEYQDGKCVRQGATNCTIKAHEMFFSPYDFFSMANYDELLSKVGGIDIDGGMSFSLSGNIPSEINTKFNLPIIEEDDVLPDRVQYGRLTNRSWRDPKEPVVCNIFNNLECIRFAMTSPLRIIEFFGEFTDTREPNQTAQYGK